MGVGGSLINKSKHFLLTLFSIIPWFFFYFKPHDSERQLCQAFPQNILLRKLTNDLFEEFTVWITFGRCSQQGKLCERHDSPTVKQALHKSGLFQKPKCRNARQVNRKQMNFLSFHYQTEKNWLGENAIDKSNQSLKMRRFATKRGSQYAENNFRQLLCPNHTLNEEYILILKSS